MKTPFQRLFSLLMVLVMLCSMMPAVYADSTPATEPADEPIVLTEEDYAVVNDVFARIDAMEDAPAKKNASQTQLTDAAAQIVMASDNYVEGSLERNGDSFTWWTDEGIRCIYNPRMRQIYDNMEAPAEPEPDGIYNEPVATKGGWPSGNQVYLIAPYYGIDDSFTDQYKNETKSIASAIGDTDGYTLYSGTSVTVDKVADAIENGAVVIFDSHGTTDYDGSYVCKDPDGYEVYDYVSEAKYSYLCLTNKSGLTTEDYNDGATYFTDSDGVICVCINGATIANHMDKNSPGGIVWMAICLGMATNTMCNPLREMGVEVVYGYSQSVTFAGDYLFEETFWDNMIAGKTVAQSISAMKSKWGKWDWSEEIASAYGYSGTGYTLAQARQYRSAFPIVVSDEDTHPGQRKGSFYGADSLQTVQSTYTLFEPKQTATTTTVDYVYSGKYVYNWGQRSTKENDTTATFMSPMAEEWYKENNVTYESLSALSGASSPSSVPSSELYQELRSLMRSAVTSTTGYDGTKTLFQYTDCQNSGGKISSFYSGKSIGPSWDGSWNREHTWPNSKGDNNGSGENDIFMLRPTSTSENSSRGNDAYGESGGNYYHPNAESGGQYDLRGDVVRIIMFVYVRWQNISGGTGVLYGESGVIQNREIMLKWMEEDPVDTWELGRNDACQAITGTRNVFVDYPELGFLLFGAEVPDNYQSPSGGASTPSYTITATSNNTSYGTVSVNGKTITATPQTGYFASGYTVTSGNATVTQNGNVFTVNAQSDCTVQINFEARKTVTVSFAGADVSSISGYSGDTKTLPTVTAPEGYTFLGWMETALREDTTTKPTYYTGSYTLKTSTTLYALYSYTEDGGTGSTEYVLTDFNAINDTDSVVITMTTSAGTTYALTSANGSSAAPTAVKVNVANGKLSNEPADALKWNIIGEKNFTIYPEGDTSRWLYSSSENNGIRVGTTKTNTFIIDSKYGYLQNTNYNRYVGVYTTNPDWRSYTSMHANIANQTLGFYVRGKGGTTYYTGDPVKCEHTNTVNKPAQNATCTASGYTAGVYCNDCQTYISGHEVQPALGHSWNSGVITTPATCTAAGVKTYTCQRCSDTKTEAVAATGHSYNSGVITTPATCTTAGVKTFTCANCGNKKTESVTATGHNHILSGNTYTCTNCGDKYDVFFISFSVPAGVSAVEKIEYTEGGITLPAAGVPTGEQTYTFEGWTTELLEDTDEKPELYKAGQKFIATQATKLYAVYSYVQQNESGGNGDYVKVTEAPADWSGEYLIVYEAGKLIFDGSRTSLDDKNNFQGVTIVDNTISANNGNKYQVVITSYNGGYSIQTASGYYIGATENSNSLNSSKTTVYKNTISLNADGTVNVIGSGGAYLRYNHSDSRFRYYKSGTYTNQKAIALYVKNGSVGVTHYTGLDIGQCSHPDEVPVVTDSTLTEYGYTTLYCSDCGEELYIEDYTAPLADVKWNVTLKDDLSVNFQIKLDASIKETVQFSLVFNEQTYPCQITDNLCTVSVDVAAAQMADIMTLYIVNGEESAVKEYSIKQYADQILSDEKQSAYHQLVKEMLNYGGAAQAYFGYNTENFVSTELGAQNVPAEAKEMIIKDDSDVISFYGASLVYRDKLAIRFYFTGNAEGMEFEDINENIYTATEINGLWCVEIDNIMPHELDQQILLTADGIAVLYGPMNYIVRMNQKGDAKLQNLMKALYNYYWEAKKVA